MDRRPSGNSTAASKSSCLADDPTRGKTDRRRFLQAAGASTAAALAAPNLARGFHVAGDDLLRVGLVGCGGRGTGAAVQALTADANTQLVAVGDAFEDRALACRNRLQNSEVFERVDLPDERVFHGFDAYQHVIDASDVVLLCATPHFRPIHLQACIDAGKHVFAEKPVAVDAPGVHAVLRASEQAAEKGLTIVSGLCWRYETGLIETMRRLHDGAIGDIRAVEATRYGGGVWVRPREPQMTEMEYQMRNWYYYTWLSGDFITEQFIHQLDQIAWTLRDQYPERCYCVGGRQTRTGPEYGHIYDHFNAVYEYADGVRAYAGTRHQRGCDNVGLCHAIGTEGNCSLMDYDITGERPWKWEGRRTVMHQLEHDAMYAALRRGDVINNGEYMAKSTMMAMLARMSAYTGRTVTWEEAMESDQRLAPSDYTWDASPPPAEVAMPGVTPLA